MIEIKTCLTEPGPTVRGDGGAGKPKGSDPDRRDRTLIEEEPMRRLAKFSAVAALATLGFGGIAVAQDPEADAVESFTLPNAACLAARQSAIQHTAISAALVRAAVKRVAVTPPTSSGQLFGSRQP